MRETKYRGMASSGWVYGTPVFYDDATAGMVVVGLDRVSVVAVAPETVGEFIGRYDREGIRIYEHDIVDVTIPEGVTLRGVVKFKDGGFYVETEATCLFNWPDYEVLKIGNIHDNPELVESEQGGI
jgi:hypothetical protein